MATRTTAEITMPQMGESVTEGTILEWRKQEGDPVDQDEAIVDVSTDKVDTEVPSPVAGTLTKILVQPDETVPVGTVLGRDRDERPQACRGRAGLEEPAELVDVEFPQMGDSVTEGTVLEWLKQVGDQVAARRRARRDLDRQGGRCDALAGRRHARRDPRPGR